MTETERPDPAALRRLLAAGTPQPWAVRQDCDGDEDGPLHYFPVGIGRQTAAGVIEEDVIESADFIGPQDQDNAALLVAAVNALPFAAGLAGGDGGGARVVRRPAHVPRHVGRAARAGGLAGCANRARPRRAGARGACACRPGRRGGGGGVMRVYGKVLGHKTRHRGGPGGWVRWGDWLYDGGRLSRRFYLSYAAQHIGGFTLHLGRARP